MCTMQEQNNEISNTDAVQTNRVSRADGVKFEEERAINFSHKIEKNRQEAISRQSTNHGFYVTTELIQKNITRLKKFRSTT